MVVLLVAESGVYTYRWNQGYISTPTFVKRMSVAAGGLAGGTAGSLAGAAIGEKVDKKKGGIIGGLIGGIGGAIVGGFTAADIVEDHYAEIDQVQEDAFLDYLYSQYGQERKWKNATLLPAVGKDV